MIDRSLVSAVNIALESDRLELEPIEGRHAQLLFQPMQDPAIYEWISSTPPLSVAALEEQWAKVSARWLEDHDDLFLNWAVRRKSDGAWIGKMDAEIDSAKVVTNFGYFFFPPYWRQGYATESVCCLSEHFLTAGIKEQRATVTSGNDVSARVLERAGFVQTRVLPGNDRVRGALVDDIEFIRREEGR